MHARRPKTVLYHEQLAAAILLPSCLLRLERSVLEALLQLALGNPSAGRAHLNM